MDVPEEHCRDTSAFFLRLDADRARLIGLVLTARGIPHRLQPGSEGRFHIFVTQEDKKRAAEEIRLYFRENRDFCRRKGQESAGFSHLKGSLSSVLVLACLLSATFRYEVRQFLMDRWAADSSRIIEGESYRAVTSLFLHADPAHFFSNIFMAGLFFTILFEETGVGTGWFLVLCGAYAGNYVNALMYGYGHVSIGLSTAIFSCIGTYSGLRAAASGVQGTKDAFKVVLSGLALLGLLGTGEGRVDVSAHFFGFVSGLVIGAAVGLVSRIVPVGSRFLDVVLAVASVATVAFSVAASLGILP